MGQGEVSDSSQKQVSMRYFIECQGYQVKDNILNQDDVSSIKLKTNGLKSAEKRLRHLKVRFYFVADMSNIIVDHE